MSLANEYTDLFQSLKLNFKWPSKPFKFYFAHFTMKHPVARMMNRLESIQALNFCLAISKLRKLLTLEIKKVLKNV